MKRLLDALGCSVIGASMALVGGTTETLSGMAISFLPGPIVLIVDALLGDLDLWYCRD